VGNELGTKFGIHKIACRRFDLHTLTLKAICGRFERNRLAVDEQQSRRSPIGRPVYA
jgi:hypothetical protein